MLEPAVALLNVELCVTVNPLGNSWRSPKSLLLSFSYSTQCALPPGPVARPRPGPAPHRAGSGGPGGPGPAASESAAAAVLRLNRCWPGPGAGPTLAWPGGRPHVSRFMLAQRRNFGSLGFLSKLLPAVRRVLH